MSVGSVKGNAAENNGTPGEQTGEMRAPCRALLQEQVQCPQCGKGMCRKTLLYKHAATCRPLVERRAAYDSQLTSCANHSEGTRAGTSRGTPEGQAWAPVKGLWRTTPLTQWAPLGYGPPVYS